MFWTPLFHFYQPKNQQEDILEAIVNQSYRRVLSFLEKSQRGKMTLNVNAGTLELLQAKGYEDVISTLKNLALAGKIEFTGTAAYHAFPPLLPSREIRRQILLNQEICQKILGEVYQPKGFFSPELAYDEKTARIIAQMGFEWTAAEELAVPQLVEYDWVYTLQGHPLQIFFRDKRASVLILSGITRSAESLFFELGEEELKKNRYLLTVMDFETFGHHRPGLEEVLFELWEDSAWEVGFISQLAERFPKRQKVRPRACTWSNEEQDFWLDQERTQVSKHPFLLWQDPKNPIHKLQWEFTGFVLRTIQNPKSKIQNPKWGEARGRLDQALASDQYWWASAKPWWSLEMIELGAWELKRVIEVLCDGNSGGQDDSGNTWLTPSQMQAPFARRRRAQGSAALRAQSFAQVPLRRPEGFTHSPGFGSGRWSKCVDWLSQAEDYYRRILDLAFEWQRSGEIRRRHREAYGTVKKTPMKQAAPRNWYNLLILEFEDEMEKATQKLEYEKAIKWRDAIIKLREGLDIYDVLHVVDDLRQVRNIPSLKSFWEHEPGEFSDFAKRAFKGYCEEEFKVERGEKIKKIKEREKAFKEKKIKFEDESDEFKLD